MKARADEREQKVEVLQLLRGEGFYSGELIAKQLGISRAAVWKRIEKLRASGVLIERLPGKGYRLASPIELLDESAILRALPPESMSYVSSVEVLSCIESTSVGA